MEIELSAEEQRLANLYHVASAYMIEANAEYMIVKVNNKGGDGSITLSNGDSSDEVDVICHSEIGPAILNFKNYDVENIFYFLNGEQVNNQYFSFAKNKLAQREQLRKQKEELLAKQEVEKKKMEQELAEMDKKLKELNI